MNKTWSAYRKAVKQGLYCGRKVKKRLLAELDGMAAPLLAENADPTWEELESALGTPDMVSVTLMENTSPQEQVVYRRERLLLRICIAILAIVLVALTLWLLFCATRPVYVVEEIYVD
ncbi:MAG: hypothetical protein LUC39_02470 [Clostridiales bacterium]|nr:hypothetical protein [Clostridiales bacterium]